MAPHFMSLPHDSSDPILILGRRWGGGLIVWSLHVAVGVEFAGSRQTHKGISQVLGFPPERCADCTINWPLTLVQVGGILGLRYHAACPPVLNTSLSSLSCWAIHCCAICWQQTGSVPASQPAHFLARQ